MYGASDNEKRILQVSIATLIFVVITMILVLVLLLSSSSSFANDYGIGQRGDVIAAVPSYEEESLRQKVDRWGGQPKSTFNNNTSNLTGTRDIPVFFQDYDVEAKRNGAGAVSTAREGFSGGRADNDLEKALAGH